MNSLQKNFIKFYMSLLLKTFAVAVRRPYLYGFARNLAHFLANSVIKTKKIQPAHDLETLGKMWQKGFPSAKQVPITHIDEQTVYAEIHTPCPLRATGDTQACWRMMEYDRKIVEQAGGEFVVLASQAEAGRTFCQVAMRFKGQAMSDLIPAHQK
ncbi:MAG: hypothetical protein MUE85_22235 [Microscillaceae bacterium]|jgi:hypothetical protein|nr:hypothetical protein [Microscillaceae bacterium]